MAVGNAYVGASLQRCAYARALLEVAATHTATQSGSSVLNSALLHSAIYHLNSAYVQHLRGLTENYSNSEPSTIADAQELSAILAGQGLESSELVEIQVLLEDKASWLGECLNTYELFQDVLGRAGAVSHGGIDLYQQQTLATDISLETVETWLSAMLELLERQQSLMYEY